MFSLEKHRTALFLSACLIGSAALSSCTTTSNLAVSQSNFRAVNQIAEEAADVPTDAVSSEVIVGTPREVEPLSLNGSGDAVAVDRPALPRADEKPPVLLASVPRTPVSNRPTNQIMMVRTTAYSHLEADSLQYGKLSAAGNTLQYGARQRSAAADWSKYPLGTRFMIEGLPYEYVVDDYGSALCGTETIDIYKPDMGSIGQWGVRNVPIRVLEWGSFEESRKILDSRKHVRHANHVREMLSEIEKKGKSGYLTPADGGSA